MDINKGDLFIYRSKYGGITKGIIESDFYIYTYDADLACIYKDMYIRSTNGISYLLNEIVLVERYLDPGENGRIERIKLMLKNAKLLYND